MTDKPPATALDRLRAGLRRRDGAGPADDGGQSAPPPAEEPPAPARGGPAEIESASPDKPEAEPAREPPAAAPEPPRPDTEIVELRRQMRVSIDSLKIVHEEQLSRTRLRINLRWAAAVILGVAMIASAGYAGYSYLSHNREELFQRHWPWRAHVWNNYGGSAMWCINEARKQSEPFNCVLNNVSRLGPIASGSSSKGTASGIAVRLGKPPGRPTPRRAGAPTARRSGAAEPPVVRRRNSGKADMALPC